jgi:hypothetical protein
VTITAYQLAVGNTPDDLYKAVLDGLMHSYQPYYQPFIDINGRYCQPLIIGTPPGGGGGGPPPGSAIVSPGDGISLRTNGTDKGVGTAYVIGEFVGVDTGPDYAVVTNGGSTNVSNLDGSKFAGAQVNVDGTGNVTMQLFAPTALVSNNQALTIGGSTYTFTVAGGLITNIVVS